jgi:hypothetical protein
MKHNKTVKLKRHVFEYTDFNSGDGMLTAVWGPGMWHYLHTMSFNYPVKPTNADKKNYRDFVLSLKNTLPCGKCRGNLKQNFKMLPLKMAQMESRETFSKYIYELHEIVNKMLHKKSGLSYAAVRDRYEQFRSRCIKTAKQTSKIHEKGCTDSLYGEKSKCILQIVPQDKKCDTLQIDEQCIKKKLQ